VQIVKKFILKILPKEKYVQIIFFIVKADNTKIKDYLARFKSKKITIYILELL